MIFLVCILAGVVVGLVTKNGAAGVITAMLAAVAIDLFREVE